MGVTQKTAWFLENRIRKVCVTGKRFLGGDVEVDEIYIGGREKNKHALRLLKAGRRAVGK
ncbi:hypothetical protein ACWWAD_09055 [Xylella fastidiosa subsp. multiplex]|uniref:hypothetical protein n=1 Tax=Xylella fastidiosa TaxID=2371 RepID=UPI00215652F2|nr:hypothetical protein [Xylella fastidiosa]